MVKKRYRLSETTIDIYFQKSFKFLYPLLGIKYEVETSPTQTFIMWGNEAHAYQLYCVYDLKEDKAFKDFERLVLQRNRYYQDFILAENNKGIYVFDLTDFANDYTAFLGGKYSQFLPETKATILQYFIQNPFTHEYMDSFLYPEKYYDVYAKRLNVSITVLKAIGQLCDPPDLDKEMLVIDVAQNPLIKAFQT